MSVQLKHNYVAAAHNVYRFLKAVHAITCVFFFYFQMIMTRPWEMTYNCKYTYNIICIMFCSLPIYCPTSVRLLYCSEVLNVVLCSNSYGDRNSD